MLREGDVFYDVGANAGFYSLLASRLVGPSGRVVAFEPLPSNLTLFREHLRLNGVENVEVIEAAVAARAGRASFDPSASRFTARLQERGALEVKTVCLDNLVASQRIPPPSVLKMDIEGGEYEALRGAIELLRRTKPYVVLALHGQEMQSSCRRLFDTCGYRIEHLSGLEESGFREVIAVPKCRGTRAGEGSP